MARRFTRKVKMGSLEIGGGAPISVQSMTKTDTRDVKATIAQIRRLEKAGCEIIRVAVPDREAASSLGRIKRGIRIPLVADIHFDHHLAIMAIEEGVDGIRLNPGNIRERRKVEAVVKAAKAEGIPIRIGVNSGSLPGGRRRAAVGVAEAMVEAASDYIDIFEGLDFHDIIISLKASDVPTTIKAYRLMANRCDYPFHLGITAAGPPSVGAIRSAIGMGILLFEGMGDTIRVSLTGPPEEEVKAGYEILRSLGLRERGVTIISCPTCGRCEIDLVKVVQEVEEDLQSEARNMKPIKVAVMGCVVNGPGEAKEADIGIAGGKGVGILFRKGKVVEKVKEKDLVKRLLEELSTYHLRGGK